MIGLLSAALATNQPVALSNTLHQKTGLTISIPDKNDPVEKEFQKVLAEDDTAQAEADRWIKDEQSFAQKGAGIGMLTIRDRVEERLSKVKTLYQEFLQKYPSHARAHLAYGSFLSDIGEEQLAQMEWEKSRELDPTNPAAWNNLANWYGHNGPAIKAFEYYAKAIELNPAESTYYQNLATTVYIFRHDATNYFKMNSQQVFEKAMSLYREAMKHDPDNFILATDYAQTYYGFPKTGNPEADRENAKKVTADALKAWQYTLKLARDDIERQGVLIHFARLQINAGDYAEARKNLNSVTNDMFSSVKKMLSKKLDNREKKE